MKITIALLMACIIVLVVLAVAQPTWTCLPVTVRYDWERVHGFKQFSVDSSSKLFLLAQAIIRPQAKRVVAGNLMNQGFRSGRGSLTLDTFLWLYVARPSVEQWGSTFEDPEATTLMQAAKSGNLDLAQESIRTGADINAQDQRGWTALVYAIQNGQDNVVRLLLRKGADVNVGDRQRRTPLFWAIVRCREFVVPDLLSAGAGRDNGDIADAISHSPCSDSMEQLVKATR